MELKEKLITSFNYLKNKYFIITTIKEGDKLYYDNSKIKLDESSVYQFAYRWYYNHNRIDFFKNFIKDIDDYYSFRHHYKNFKIDALNNKEMFQYFFNEIKEIDLFHTKFLEGLDKLKITYKNDNDIVNQIIHLIVLLN